jgi:YVTN family beta-propeller protein
VIPIATATNTAGPPIPAGAGVIAITPDGKTAYITNQISGTVTPITTATNTAGPPIPVGTDPFWIAITPGHRHSRGRLHQRLRQHAHSPGTEQPRRKPA